MPSKKRATPISLQPLDALFGTNEETNNGICEIEIGSLGMAALSVIIGALIGSIMIPVYVIRAVYVFLRYIIGK